MIAVDVMGGDFAPHVVLKGALKAAQQGSKVRLFGPEDKMLPFLDKEFSGWRSLEIALVHAGDVIGMGDEPVSAVRKKQSSSLVRAVESVACGESSAMVSAGNSGALMVASVFVLGREEGVERPAIAGVIPGAGGNVIGLDLGANTECKPHHLVQFAHMGAAYARRMSKIENPRVSLLANGEEDSKGSLLTKETFALLSKEQGINFIGNTEPHDILFGKTDVFVCDGFTGNIFLKTFEAVFAQKMAFFRALLHQHAVEVGESAVVKELENRCNAALNRGLGGGALLIGVQGPVFVCHGAAQVNDIAQAIKSAEEYAKSGKNS